jgi:hypothetical protein
LEAVREAGKRARLEAGGKQEIAMRVPRRHANPVLSRRHDLFASDMTGSHKTLAQVRPEPERRCLTEARASHH